MFFGGELVIKIDALLDRRVLTRLLEQKEDRTCLIIFHRHPVLTRVNRLPILERSSLPSRKNALSLRLVCLRWWLKDVSKFRNRGTNIILCKSIYVLMLHCAGS